MAIFKECSKCKKFYFDKRYTKNCKDCRDKEKGASK